MNATPGGADEVKATIRSFIVRSINLPELGDGDDLFATGLVNSLFAVQLTTFIEKKFRVEIAADDLDIKNFSSLDAATDFVLRKRAAVAA
jgi:methoxymalonate biosynthesis acyl carrier protein